jgi:hypothetical protein
MMPSRPFQQNCGKVLPPDLGLRPALMNTAVDSPEPRAFILLVTVVAGVRRGSTFLERTPALAAMKGHGRS